MASEPDPRPDAADLLAEAGFLRRLATELVALPHDADDLVQETWVRALEHAPQRSTSLRGWLSVVARNLAFNSSRGQRRRDEHERRAARPEALEPGDIALEKFEQQQRLFELVLSLPAEQRTVLYLRYYEGLTPTEIAQRLRTPLKTVKTRQTRALAALRERLDARNGGDGKSWRLALTPLGPLSPAPTAGSLVTTLLGGIVVKKTLTVAAVVLLALVSWFGWRRIADAHPEPSHSMALAEPAQVSPPPPAAPLSAEVLAQREELAPSAAPASATPAVGRAEITLLWSDGTPAVGVGATMDLAKPRGTPKLRVRGMTDASGLLVFESLALGRNRLSVDLRETFWLEMPENEGAPQDFHACRRRAGARSSARRARPAARGREHCARAARDLDLGDRSRHTDRRRWRVPAPRRLQRFRDRRASPGVPSVSARAGRRSRRPIRRSPSRVSADERFWKACRARAQARRDPVCGSSRSGGARRRPQRARSIRR
jgi:RNA polymerase sigma-70 factor (ECF subfamily)